MLNIFKPQNMKSIYLSIALFVCTLTYSQVETPQPSPLAHYNQDVGLTNIKIDYSRPSVKGRVIFGDLVPYGKLWRTGANQSTTITFEHDVVFGSNAVKKGTYELFTIPNPNQWEIILYNDEGSNGNPDPIEEDKVVARVNTESKTSAAVESFTLSLGNLTNSSADLILQWDKTIVQVPIEVGTDKMVMDSIDKTFNPQPNVNDYYRAASYYLSNNLDLEQAKKWNSKIMETRDALFWVWVQKALIHESLNEMLAAKEAAEKAKKLAKEIGEAQMQFVESQLAPKNLF